MIWLLLSLLQVPRSQHGSVTQRVGHTDIVISYNRPVARGRELFGTLVHWDRMWHPGADSLSTIPEEPPKPWTVIFNKGIGGWHTNYPGESQDALRVTVASETGPHFETLTYYFPLVDADSAMLRLQWGTMVVPLKLKVTQ